MQRSTTNIIIIKKNKIEKILTHGSSVEKLVALDLPVKVVDVRGDTQ